MGDVVFMGELKRKRLWIYLSDQDQEKVTRLAEVCAPLKESDLCSALVAAAIAACDKAGGITLPLKLEVASKKAVRGGGGGGIKLDKDSAPALKICSI